ncbi:cation:proton antiporter family protein [Zwartia sp.]|uniref:cation:proton antiporter n=1 Tax=Zwartia sp. TaxID=2978004 RepID=UPI002716FAFE|nr:cation:proton antiporter family protein [Zwartia sp.]MDO9025281.1 cation:proton antiporter [Zwartia sp.]
MHQVFTEIALILIVSTIAGAIGLRLRQPVLIAYIVVGILVGPSVLGLVSAHSQIDLLSQVGIAVLLFLVGLKLDLTQVRQLGPVALATGLGQLAFTITFGFILIVLMGKSLMEALYVAIALTFSSTIIIVKLLSDKRELDSLHGRIAVGFLIVQDLAVVLAMMVMSVMKVSDPDVSMFSVAGSLMLRIAIAGAGLYILMRWVLPKIVSMMARSQELLLIFAIAWGTGLAAVGEWAGFSKEAGAFLAGFSIASSGYRDAISARLTGIRDFLLLFFFIDLGSKLDFSTLGDEFWPSMGLSAFVLIGNPLIVMAIMGYMGYRKRTGFLAGLTVAQISEFSIIFIAMGISLGHVGQSALGLTTLVGLITIALSTYMILYSQPLYEKCAPYLGWLERKKPFREMDGEEDGEQIGRPDVLVIGLGRYGGRLAQGLQEAGLKVLGVDFDPDAVRKCRELGIPVHYGDGIDENFIETLPLHKDLWVVSTLPNFEANAMLMDSLKAHKFSGDVAVVAREEMDGIALKKIGVPTVLYPMRDAVDYAANALAEIIRPNASPKEEPLG